MPTKNDLSEVPAALEGVALVSAATCAATGNISLSQWYAEISAGLAPKPVVQRPRFTRWSLVEVRAYWARVATQGIDQTVALRMAAQAKKASDVAKVKRHSNHAAQQRPAYGSAESADCGVEGLGGQVGSA